MLTAYPDPDYLFKALKAGAAGYVLKHSSPNEVLAAVRGCSPASLPSTLGSPLTSSADWWTRKKSIAKTLPTIRREKGRKARPCSRSSRRARKKSWGTSRGRTNPQIARRLSISSGTAKIHVQNILLKLGVSDRVQAAVLAVESGLASTEEDRPP